MRAFPKAVLAGVLTGILGLLLYFSLNSAGIDLEESIGLNLLFKLRGTRAASPDVVIVSLDKASADYLNLPDEPQKWPRSLHARLTEYLAEQGAAVIAFDILFEESRSEKDDALFAEAIQKAGNVVLCECLKKDGIYLPAAKAAGNDSVYHIETLLPPVQCLAESALALAPFPLPKVPVKVSQYWTFKTAAGDTPTLPVVAYQVFALEKYNRLLSLLKEFAPAQAGELPPDKKVLIKTKGIENTVRAIRDTFKQQPGIAAKMLDKLMHASGPHLDGQQAQRLVSLVRMYQSPDSHFLNFYGPPGTITTIPFYQLVKNNPESAAGQKQVDLRGKAVFVGLSEQLRPEQKDGFHTVYSQPNGVDISGVEIAATAFANLLEDRPLRRVNVHDEALIILAFGLILGIFCRFFSAGVGAAGALVLSGVYLFVARQQFNSAAEWYPVTLPLFFLTPIAFFGNLLWKYSEANKERQRIRIAFRYYLPDKIANQEARNITDIKANREIIDGTCLMTDAGQYTTLSDTLDPGELSDFMREYYMALYTPVKKYGGMVINIVGDSMLALWGTKSQDPESRRRACLAALEIARAATEFSRSSGRLTLPTRIGMDFGRIMLGNIGALDHYEYRPTGSAVNTASRLEGLNKLLETKILVSNHVLDKINGFLVRALGVFLMQGKKTPTAVCELICRQEEATHQQQTLNAVFAEGLAAYRSQYWEKAVGCFQQCLKVFNDDGPARFYLKLCEQFRTVPPEEGWDGVVRLSEK